MFIVHNTCEPGVKPPSGYVDAWNVCSYGEQPQPGEPMVVLGHSACLPGRGHEWVVWSGHRVWTGRAYTRLMAVKIALLDFAAGEML